GDLEGVDVFHQPLGGFPVQQIAVANDVHLEGNAGGHGVQEHRHHGRQHQGVTDEPGPQHLGLGAAEIVFGGKTDELQGIAHLVHHRVAGVDTEPAADAFVLEAVADIYAG